MTFQDLEIGTNFYFDFDGSPSVFRYKKVSETDCLDLITGDTYTLFDCLTAEVHTLEK